MKKIAIIGAVLFIYVTVTASYGADYWAKTYGGDDEDAANHIEQTLDGGYIMAGITRSFGAGERDIWIMKLDSRGNVTWQKTYGGAGKDYLVSIHQTTDNGYIVGTWTGSFGGYAWVFKLNEDGDVEWQRTIDWNGAIRSIQQTSDGGYIVAGDIPFDAFLVKLDSNGEYMWVKRYSGGDFTYVQQTIDGGYIVSGRTTLDGAGGLDAWILKLDAIGNIEWQKTYGWDESEVAACIKQTSDGGYIIAGSTEPTSGSTEPSYEAWILKLDSNGNVIWQKTYGGSNRDRTSFIQEISNGVYIASGYTQSFGGGTDYWLLKLDSNGNIIWQKTYGISADDYIAKGTQQTTDGGYILAGRSYNPSDILVLKLDSNGEIPDCDIIDTSDATVAITNIEGQDISATAVTAVPGMSDTSMTPQDSLAEVTTICSWIDSDDDGIPDISDNCPNHPNGSLLGTCIHGTIGTTCTSNEECDITEGDGFCSMDQEDTYPPGGNNIGDACECEGDFDRNGAVDADDVTKFLEDFGRSQFNNPCP